MANLTINIDDRIERELRCYHIHEYTQADRYSKHEDAKTILGVYHFWGTDGVRYFYTGRLGFCRVGETFRVRATVYRIGDFGVKFKRPYRVPVTSTAQGSLL